MSIGNLIIHFNGYVPLNDKEREELGHHVTEKTIKRREFILRKMMFAGITPLLFQGFLKMYAVDDSGIEHNIQFASENEWIMDLGSFHSEKPSLLYIEAIEPSVILQIKRSNLISLLKNFKTFNINFRVIIENKFIELQNRLLQNLVYAAEERYLTFLEQYSKLANRLPNTQIASYLGITPEFLGKIRNTISKK